MTKYSEQTFDGKIPPTTLRKIAFPAVCMAVMLYEFGALAAGWSQNLDAKPVDLPLGLKFGDVYEGAIRSTKSDYMNGIELKRCDAVHNERLAWLQGNRRDDDREEARRRRAGDEGRLQGL